MNCTDEPKSLREVNHILQRHNLQPIDRRKLDALLHVEGREKLVQALAMIDVDPASLEYLTRLLAKGPQPHPPQDQNRDPIVGGASIIPLRGPTPSPGEQAEARARTSKHVYGQRAALCFEPDVTRGGAHTVSVDAADSTGPRQYNWGAKLRLQLTRDELLNVTAVLYGFLPRCEFKNHGADNSKGFSLEDQGDKLFMRVFAKGQTLKAVPISPEDAYHLAQLCLDQLRKGHLEQSPSDILMPLKYVFASRRQLTHTSVTDRNRQMLS